MPVNSSNNNFSWYYFYRAKTKPELASLSRHHTDGRSFINLIGARTHKRVCFLFIRACRLNQSEERERKRQNCEEEEPVERRGVGRSVEFNSAWKTGRKMNTSGMEIGEVVHRALESLERRRKGTGRERTESEMGANHERDRAGRQEETEDE